MINWARSKASTVLLSAVSSLAIFEALSPTSVRADVTLTAKPAVVRIVTACIGQITIDDIERPYATGEIGTGFFVNASGYIVTNYHVVKLAGPSRKEACKQRLVRNVVKDITGAEITYEGFDSEPSLQDVPDEQREKVISLISQSEESLEGKSSLDFFSKVILQNGETLDFDTKKEGDDNIGKGKDIAVIKTETQQAPTLQFSRENTDPLEIRDEITVIGYPVAADVQDQSKFFSELFESENCLIVGNFVSVDGS